MLKAWGSRLLCYVLSFGMLVPFHAIAQSSRHTNYEFQMSREDLERSIVKYQELAVAYNDFGLKALVAQMPILRKENPIQLELIFKKVYKLPTIKLSGDQLQVYDDDKIIESLKVADLLSGFIKSEQGTIKLRTKLGFVEALKEFRNSSYKQSKIDKFLDLFFPRAWANGGILAILLALLGALFGGGTSKAAQNAAQDRAAQEAIDRAIAEGRPLGEDSIPAYQRGAAVPAPHYMDNSPNGSANNSSSGKSYPEKDQQAAIAYIQSKANEIAQNPNCSNNPSFNQNVLASVVELQTNYSNRGHNVGDGGFTMPIDLVGNRVAPGGNPHGTHCTTATYYAFTSALNKTLAPGSLLPAAATHFKSGKEDNMGIWGIWNNNYGGAGDIPHYINTNTGENFGYQEVDPAKFCPGDFLKLDRTSGPGHSVVFLGFEDGKICYWSSNSGTNGFGKQCEDLSRIGRFSALKVKDPSVVTRLKGQYNKDDSTINGQPVYSGQYNKSQGPAVQALNSFKRSPAASSPAPVTTAPTYSTPAPAPPPAGHGTPAAQ